MSRGIPFLMYHELVRPARALCRPEAGYRRYCITTAAFRDQLARLAAEGLQGWSVSRALQARTHEEAARGVAITFDDGCETDLLAAAPLLREAGHGATFFVVSAWVGTPGYLDAAGLRELHALGFEIGAHSRTHAYLSDLAPAALEREVAGAKVELEQLVGAPVEHFSCPGGRWSPGVREAARAAGYRSLSTSERGTVDAGTDPFRLPRTAILEDTRPAAFARIVRGERQWLQDARHGLLAGAKHLMGNALYERVRGAALGR